MHIRGATFFQLSKFLVFSKFWPVECGTEAKKGEISPDSTKPNSGGRKDTIAFECSMGNAWCSSDTWLFLGEFFVTHVFCGHQTKEMKMMRIGELSPVPVSSQNPCFSLFTESVNVINFGIWRLQIHEESWSSEARLQISTDPFFPAEKNWIQNGFFLQQQKSKDYAGIINIIDTLFKLTN